MPTADRRRRLQPDDVRPVVEASCFPSLTSAPTAPDGVGVEVEVLPIHAGPGATRRLTLDEVLAITAELAATGSATVLPVEERPDGTVTHPLRHGGALTFEPGAQLEVSGACAPTPAAALDAAETTLEELARAFAEHDVVLASAGVDVWHEVAAVPQQLAAPRYPAMATYLADRGPWGATMMRHTASLQVNLDLGVGATADERWAVATLAAPLAVATFATSPEPPGAPRVAARRAQAWRHLDPTRAGIPPGFCGGVAGPVATMTAAALDADVLLVNAPTGTVPGRPGWPFLRWLLDGDATHGWPTVDDLRYHLTTLFHEVRPRGALEVRSIDALPARWRSVPVVLYAGLLYDDRARGQVLDVLSSHRRDLRELLWRATIRGLADPQLCALAVETWSYALEGARRLPAGHVRPGDLVRCEAFIDRFTLRGQAPTDVLRELLASDPVRALRWAGERRPRAAAVTS